MVSSQEGNYYNENDKVWHILTKTRKGVVWLFKELDAPTARQVYKKLRPDDYPRTYINIPESGSWIHSKFSSIGDSDISSVTILGPEGHKLDPWKGVEPVVFDLTPEIEQQRIERELYKKVQLEYSN